MTIGVIDIGSNAIRLALTRTDKKEPRYLKSLREPVRLGADCFDTGAISEKTLEKLIEAFRKFQAIFNKFDVRHYKAVATSALRDAQNREEVVKKIFESTKIKIDIIDGLEECRLIHAAVAGSLDLTQKRSLIVDIGGGSVEVIVSRGQQVKIIRSLNIGTLRLMRECGKNPQYRRALRHRIHEEISTLVDVSKVLENGGLPLMFIGTGGNVRSLERLNMQFHRKIKDGQMTFEQLEEISDQLFKISYKDRVEKLGLRKDRADVILPASIILLEFMRLYHLKKLHVPKVGLKDGLLTTLKHSHLFKGQSA